jgi:hypothetical protein
VKSEEEHQEELDVYSKTSQDLKTRLDTLQLELNEKQVNTSYCLIEVVIKAGLTVTIFI